MRAVRRGARRRRGRASTTTSSTSAATRCWRPGWSAGPGPRWASSWPSATCSRRRPSPSWPPGSRGRRRRRPARRWPPASGPSELPLSAAQQRLWLLQQMERHVGRVQLPAGPAAARARSTSAALRGRAGRRRRPARGAAHRVRRARRRAVPADPARRAGPAGGRRSTRTEADVPRLVDAARRPAVRPGRRAAAAGHRDRGSAPDEHVLVLLLHHIATDEWSDRPFLRDLADRVRRPARRARRRTGTPLPVQYADYTLWQRELLGDPADPDSLAAPAARLLARRRSPGRRRSWTLPADRPRPGAADASPAARRSTLDARERPRRPARAAPGRRREHVHGAARRRRRRCCTGSARATTSRSARRSPGAPTRRSTTWSASSSTPLVLRTDLSGDPTLRRAAGAGARRPTWPRSRTRTCRSSRWSRRLNPARSLARNPLFQVMVGYHSRDGDDSALARAGRRARCRSTDRHRQVRPGRSASPRTRRRPGRAARWSTRTDLFDRGHRRSCSARRLAAAARRASPPTRPRRSATLDVLAGGERRAGAARASTTPTRPVAGADAARARSRARVAATPDARRRRRRRPRRCTLRRARRARRPGRPRCCAAAASAARTWSAWRCRARREMVAAVLGGR